MTDITYTYEITMVDEENKCMEIVYTSPTYGVIHVGARLPFEGEPLEQIVKMFSPVQGWRDRDATVIVPSVGETGELIDEIPPAPTLEDQVRAQRDYLLKDSDWTQLPDAPVDQTAWATYRQALRDITDQAGFPETIDWPTQPQ